VSKRQQTRYLKKVVALYLTMCVIVTGIWAFVTIRTLVLDSLSMGEICAMWCVEGALSYLLEKEEKRNKKKTETEETGI